MKAAALQRHGAAFDPRRRRFRLGDPGLHGELNFFEGTNLDRVHLTECGAFEQSRREAVRLLSPKSRTI
jgi:hypothetical protein